MSTNKRDQNKHETIDAYVMEKTCNFGRLESDLL